MKSMICNKIMDHIFKCTEKDITNKFLIRDQQPVRKIFSYL